MLALLTLLRAGTASAGCPAAGVVPGLVLPRVAAALARHQPLVFVALGSSSTRGWMASDVGHSYPAVLQALLGAALPWAHVAVINRGVGGQDALEELARLDADVLAIRPQLVIWQVGANGTIHDMPVASFVRLVDQGVAKIQAAGADLILMDNQRAPRILASAEHGRLDAALAQVAAQAGVNLFSRGALMDRWAAAGAPYRDFLAADGLHMNDRGYACLAGALAGAITAALRAPGGR